MLTHIEISQRAFHHFRPNSTIGNDYKKIIQDFPDFFTAGSPFPDWGYMCNYSDAGEATHWPPFIHSYIEYLNKNYKPSDDRYKQLVAFLFGVESHGEADVIWHWGKQTNNTDLQGYLRAMSHMASDCQDIWEDCHGVGDTGADLYLALRGNLSWMSQSWSIPVDDLYNIYKSIDLEVPKNRLWACPEIMYTGTIFERLGGGADLFDSEIHAAFLTEDLDLYFSGGIDDMAINVQWQWENTIKSIENNTEPIHNNTKLLKKNVFFKKIFEKISEKKWSLMKDLIGLKVNYTNGVLTINHNPQLVEKNKEAIYSLIRNVLGIRKNDEKTYNNKLGKDPHESNITFNTLNSGEKYSYFGKSLAKGDFNGDGVEEIVVGAPGYGNKQLGAVYIINNISNINYSHPSHVGKDVYGRFGYSVAVADLNHDGYDDLIVSAPTASFSNGPSPRIEDYYPKDYNGKIFVYYGGKEGIKANSEPNLSITSKNKKDIFYNLGSYLFTSDCNGDGFTDLLVGSPHSQQDGDNKGHAAVFLSVQNNSKEIFIEDADYSFIGQNEYHEFGRSLTCSNNTLIVGVPGFRYFSIIPNFLSQIKIKLSQASGSVVGYDLTTKMKKFSILCDFSQARFGQSLAMKDDLLAVGAPSFSNIDSKFSYHHGSIFIYNVSQLSNDTLYTKNKAFMRSYDHRSRFGHRIAFVNNDLAITAPQYSYPPHIEEGRLLVCENISNWLGEIDIESCKINAFCHMNGSRFGDRLLVTDKSIIVSAPYASHLDYFSGQIGIIEKDKLISSKLI
jgi:glycosylphosphatidylinositol phospholipase D